MIGVKKGRSKKLGAAHAGAGIQFVSRAYQASVRGMNVKIVG